MPGLKAGFVCLKGGKGVKPEPRDCKSQLLPLGRWWAGTAGICQAAVPPLEKCSVSLPLGSPESLLSSPRCAVLQRLLGLPASPSSAAAAKTRPGSEARTPLRAAAKSAQGLASLRMAYPEVTPRPTIALHPPLHPVSTLPSLCS